MMSERELHNWMVAVSTLFGALGMLLITFGGVLLVASYNLYSRLPK